MILDSSMVVAVHILMLVVQLVDFDTGVDHHSNAYSVMKVKKEQKICLEGLKKEAVIFFV